MWFQDTEGAKFWMQVLNELKSRGVLDILICCVDGLTGFPDAIEAIFPSTTVHTCVVHLIRTSLKYVPRREREHVAPRTGWFPPSPTVDAVAGLLHSVLVGVRLCCRSGCVERCAGGQD